jgi:rubredoxin
MFECDNCGNFYDKSEARENPSDDCSCICEECSWTLETEKQDDRSNINGNSLRNISVGGLK